MAEPAAGCSSCGQTTGSRVYVMNAFHDSAAVDENKHRTQVEMLPTPRCFNGMTVPANYAALVQLVVDAATEQPIRLLEIAAHGTGVPRPVRPPPITRPVHWNDAQWETHLRERHRMTLAQYDAYVERHQMANRPQYEQPRFRPPAVPSEQRLGTNQAFGERLPDGTFGLPPTADGHRRLFAPGAAIIGTTAEIVSGRTIHLNEHGHGELSKKLGEAVIPGGRIIWQCCNLGDSMAPHMSFLAAFSAKAPGRDVSAASGETAAGTTGLQGMRRRPDRPVPTYAGMYRARDGIVSTRIRREDDARDCP